MPNGTVTRTNQAALLNGLRRIHDAAKASPAFQAGIEQSVGRLHLEPEPEPEPAISPEHYDDSCNAIDLIHKLMDRFGVEDIVRKVRYAAIGRGVKL